MRVSFKTLVDRKKALLCTEMAVRDVGLLKNSRHYEEHTRTASGCAASREKRVCERAARFNISASPVGGHLGMVQRPLTPSGTQLSHRCKKLDCRARPDKRHVYLFNAMT